MSSRWRASNANSPTWKAQRSRVLQRDGYECQMRLPGCTGRATQVDHLAAWLPGQDVQDASLQAACAHCNSSAGSPEKRNPPVERPAWLQ